jgi:hypothetical protein
MSIRLEVEVDEFARIAKDLIRRESECTIHSNINIDVCQDQTGESKEEERVHCWVNEGSEQLALESVGAFIRLEMNKPIRQFIDGGLGIAKTSKKLAMHPWHTH